MAIWSEKGVTKTFRVKVKVIKLEGFMANHGKSAKMGVEIKWGGSTKFGISSLYKKSQHGHRFFTKEIDFVKIGQPIEWNDEFDHICNLSMISRNDENLFASLMVNFNLLYGDYEEPFSSSSRAKMKIIGKCGVNLGELASKMEAPIPQNVPISLEVDGVAMEASLMVLVSFDEMKNNTHSRTMSSETLFGSKQNSNDLGKSLRRAKSQGPTTLGHEKVKKNKIPSFFARQFSWKSRGGESEYVVVASSSSSLAEASSVGVWDRSHRTTMRSEAQLDMATKGGFWLWKRRKSMQKVVTPVITQLEAGKSTNPGTWQVTETISRDGKTKLHAQVFFASFDQCSEKAAGESACAVIVAVIAHWLQQNPYSMPTGPEFDHLITEGSSEWRKLCKDESNKDCFPDKHFDLETILNSKLRPLIVLPNNSHFGFFHPEEFDHLKDAKSFNDIWTDINENISDFESRVYIVRWNDHFFIMKIESKANYIIDSLGERLYEGCDQAYILKFDDSTVMYNKEDSNVICRGKECSKEYMKRFLAAISVRELKEQEAKGKIVDNVDLHKRLLIDFHLSAPPSSVSTANTSNAPTPNTSPLCLGD